MEEALGGLGTEGPCYLTRTTEDPKEAERWFEQFEGAGLDGVVAKPLDAPYTQNGRTMFKIKHARTADVVVAGYREHKNSPRPSGRCSAASCSASTTTRASSSTSASAPASPRPGGPS